MKRFLQDLWPVAAVAFFTVLLALQIPSGALFFEPGADVPAEARVEIVELDAAQYENALHAARMSWQMRRHSVQNTEFDSRADAIGLPQTLPEPEYLQLPASFGHAAGAAAAPLRQPPAALQPQSLALPMPAPRNPPADPPPGRDPELLAWPESARF